MVDRKVAECCRKAIDRAAVEEALRVAAASQRVKLDRVAVNAAAESIERYAADIAEIAARIAARDNTEVCDGCVAAAALDIAVNRIRA